MKGAVFQTSATMMVPSALSTDPYQLMFWSISYTHSMSATLWILSMDISSL